MRDAATAHGLPTAPPARSFFLRDVEIVARDLLGCLLIHDTGGDGVAVGRIVETEAYGWLDDPGSHAARGPTARNAPMFEEPGRAYVYFTYGMHHCLNAVCGPPGRAAAVLLRAVEPLEGLEAMRRRRGAVRDRDLARGPGRLTQAFAIDASSNRADLLNPPLWIGVGERLPEEASIATARIGLGTRQDGRLWRFALASSPWTSGPLRD